MPELPEVETVRRGLAPIMEGRAIARAIARRPDLRTPLPAGFGQRLTGARIERLDRRAKYLLARLSTGETLLMHLGMSGRFTIHEDGSPGHAPGDFHLDHRGLGRAGTGTHDHVIFDFAAEGARPAARIVYTDHRRFGQMDLFETGAEDRVAALAALGPEPLSDDFDAAGLSTALAGRFTPVKAALLDQRVVAGLGNIYVCEALYRARVSPRRLAASVAGVRAARLVPAIKAVLADAIAAGGSSLRDYAQADGALGYFQHRFAVYDRAGEPCRTPGCAGTVQRIVQAGRSSFFCGHCQR